MAILAIDVDGYSRMVEVDDVATAIDLTRLRRRVVRPIVARYAGFVFSIAGDGSMAAFPEVGAAIDAAIAIQRKAPRNANVRGTPGAAGLRMGVSFGEVVEIGGELFGHALNVAARLEALSPPGAIYVCGAAYDAAGLQARAELEFVGEISLRKMNAACRVYTVDITDERHR